MANLDSTIVISASIIKTHMGDGQPGPVEQELKTAMKMACDPEVGWLLTNDEQKFKAAVGAVLLRCGDEDKRRIEKTMRFLGAISAASTGIPVNFEMLTSEQDDVEPLPLMGIWHEVTGKP